MVRANRQINTTDFFKLKSLDEKIKFCLQYAVLAPSTHNTQPWLFKIIENKVQVFFDSSLKLPEGDKTNRYLYISIGCALENLILSAKYFGIFKSIQFDNFSKISDENLLAEVFFDENINIDNGIKHLIEIIPNRVNRRGHYLDTKIDNQLLEDFKNIFNKLVGEFFRLDIITNKELIEKISRVTEEGMGIAHSSVTFRKEMSGWLSNSLTKKNDGMPGFSMGIPFLLSFVMPYIIKHKNLGKKLGQLNYLSMSSASCIFVFSSKFDNPSKEEFIKLGMASERLMLELQSQKISTSIYVASAEIVDLYKKVQNILSIEDRPVFLFCAGFMEGNQKLTPKHPWTSKIIN